VALHDATTRQTALFERALAEAGASSTPPGNVPGDALADMGQRISAAVMRLDRQLMARLEAQLDRIDAVDRDRRAAIDADLKRLHCTVAQMQRQVASLARATTSRGTPALPEAPKPSGGAGDAEWRALRAQLADLAVDIEADRRARATSPPVDDLAAQLAPLATQVAGLETALHQALDQQAAADREKWADMKSGQIVLTTRVRELTKFVRNSLIEKPAREVDDVLSVLRSTTAVMQKFLRRTDAERHGQLVTILGGLQDRIDAWGVEAIGDLQHLRNEGNAWGSLLAEVAANALPRSHAGRRSQRVRHGA
jgi:hypothetical protein